MKEIWSQDTQEIIKEIVTLSEKKLPLTFIQKGQAPKTVYATGIETKNNRHKVVVFAKKEPFTSLEESRLIFYHPKRQPMRGFEIEPVHESENNIETKIPQEIVQIQRRKHPRVVKTGNSTAAFTHKGDTNMYTVTVKDICLEGARLGGAFTENIGNGDILEHVSLDLHLAQGEEYQEKIVIPEAKVQWVNDLTEGQRVMGIHFKLADAELARLDNYITMLSLQENGL